MVYASAYTYRASVWFDFVVPGPDERAWLRDKYPRVLGRDRSGLGAASPSAGARPIRGNDFAVHGTAIVGFCDLCQLVLCGGTPERQQRRDRGARRAQVHLLLGALPLDLRARARALRRHKGVVTRVLAGEMPGNLIALVRRSFGLDHDTWGKDAFRGEYPWLHRKPR